MRLHIIMHESFESPAAIEVWANNKNHKLSYTRLYQDNKLPQTTDNFDYLIIMGGPQSPATTKKECPHFDAQKEIKFIKRTIEDKKLVLGVCLGAQLIGEALAAKFEHSPNKEIGVFDLILTDYAKDDPIFSKFLKQFPVGHWHSNMPGLTSESKILATSKGCPRQIVKYFPKVYGFQCHFEFTLKSIDNMIKNSTSELEKSQDLLFVETPNILTTHNYDEINKKLFVFLDYMEYLFNIENNI